MDNLNRRLRFNSNFLHRKRALNTLKTKKTKNIKHHPKNDEKNIDFDLIKDNFRHFFHLNWEDNIFEKELQNIGKKN